jgi:hypothetical protein
MEQRDVLQTENMFVSRNTNSHGEIMVGMFLPFGENAFEWLHVDEIRLLIKHLQTALNTATIKDRHDEK